MEDVINAYLEWCAWLISPFFWWSSDPKACLLPILVTGLIIVPGCVLTAIIYLLMRFLSI